MPKPKRYGALARSVMQLLAAPSIRPRQPEPETTARPCGNPDCPELSVNQFCSADCCRSYKQNYKVVGGRNVRIA